MSWFVLMEMTLVAVMTVYLAYHTHLVFAKAKYRKIITTVIIGILIGLCLYNLIFFGFLVNACICQMTEASFKEYQKYLGNKD